MKRKKIRIISLIIISAMALTAASCTKDDVFGRSGSHIRPVVSASSVLTRSGLSSEGCSFIGSYALDGFGADSLCIAVYEFDNSDLRTRGAVITNSGINQDGEKFRMDAWLESQNRYSGSAAKLSDGRVYAQKDATDYHFMKNATAMCDGADWTLGNASPSDGWNIWRSKVPTNFWAMYPASLGSGTISLSLPADTASDDGQKTLSFDYTLPAQSADCIDAENQQDLCFAYSRKVWDDDVAGNDNLVNIHFYHALSAVYFNISGISPSDPETTIMVKKIGFKNVPSSAHCEMTGTDGDSNGNPGKLTITWTGQSSLKEYKQAYDVSSDFDGSSKDLKFEESSKVFMMIPGTLDADAELWAEFEVNGSPVEKSINISKYSNGTSVEWQPGKKYLYKLIYNGKGNLGLTGGLGPYMPDWF